MLLFRRIIMAKICFTQHWGSHRQFRQTSKISILPRLDFIYKNLYISCVFVLNTTGLNLLGPIFFVITISNKLTYQPNNVEESNRLSPIYTFRIGLLSKIKVFKVNKNNFCIWTQEKQRKQKHHGYMFRKRKRLVSFP